MTRLVTSVLLGLDNAPVFISAAAILLAATSAKATYAADYQKPKAYIRNQSDYPIRVYFLTSEIEKSFCVKRINERSGILIENMPKGHWHVAVFELVGRHGMGTDGFALVENVDGAILTVSSRNGIPEVRVSLISSPLIRRTP
jgi:hypothetical protein